MLACILEHNSGMKPMRGQAKSVAIVQSTRSALPNRLIVCVKECPVRTGVGDVNGISLIVNATVIPANPSYSLQARCYLV